MKSLKWLLLLLFPMNLLSVKPSEKQMSPVVKAAHMIRQGYGKFIKERQHSTEMINKHMNVQSEELIQSIIDNKNSYLLKRGFNAFDVKPHQHYQSHLNLYNKVMRLILLRTKQILHEHKENEVARALSKKMKKICKSQQLLTDNECKIRPIFSHVSYFLRNDYKEYPGYDGALHVTLGKQLGADLKKIYPNG